MDLLHRNGLSAVLLLALCLGAAGCTGVPKPKPVPWNVRITKPSGEAIEVDLIGVPASDQSVWANYALDDYWNPGDLRRRDADKLTSTVDPGHPWVLGRDHAKWEEWLNRGARDLLVIANPPGRFEAGPADPRRLFLPLDKKAWKARKATLEVEIQDNRLRVLTPVKR